MIKKKKSAEKNFKILYSEKELFNGQIYKMKIWFTINTTQAGSSVTAFEAKDESFLQGN